MKIELLHIGMSVRHPQYGIGKVKSIGENTAEILFNEGLRTVAPEPSGIESAEPHAQITGLDLPLNQFIKETATAVVNALGLERPENVSVQLGLRWHNGKLLLQPNDPSLQNKEIPLETFFHKLVMMRNQLRVLEQKLNGHEKLSDAEKVDLQQYITRCYGSMTTFNVLFREKEDQF